jgi:hypothetical protein
MSVALTEAGVISLWMRARLVSDVTLAGLAPGGVFSADDAPPQGTLTPYIQWGITSGPFPHRGNGATVGYVDATCSITVRSRSTDFRILDPIIARHKVLFNGVSGAVSGGVVFGSEWLREFRIPDQSDRLTTARSQ